jgi:hypothetical protein
VRAGVVLKLSGQIAQVFLVSISLTRWFSERTRKLFGKISKRT